MRVLTVLLSSCFLGALACSNHGDSRIGPEPDTGPHADAGDPADAVTGEAEGMDAQRASELDEAGKASEAGNPADTGEAGEAGGGPNTSRIDPASIPQSFAAYDKAKCGVLGESCRLVSDINCQGSICNVGIELCFPNLPGGQSSVQACTPGSCDEQAPYCLGGRCMTFDQASCICGTSGGSKLPACAAPAISALGGKTVLGGDVCLTRGARCGAPFNCCSPMTCMAGSDGKSFCDFPCAATGANCGPYACCGKTQSRCLQLIGSTNHLCYDRCTEHSQCPSGCCVEDPEGGYCAEAWRCPHNTDPGQGGDAGTSVCRPPNASCDASMPCCGGLECIMRAGAQGGICSARCTQPTDCVSGCCTPFGTTPGGYCDDASKCTCFTPGTSCNADTRKCCDGSRCTRLGVDEPSRCAKTCQSSADCGGNCCLPLDGGVNVCGLGPC